MQIGNLNLLNAVAVFGGLFVGDGLYGLADPEKREEAYSLIVSGTLCVIFGTQVSFTIKQLPTCVQPFLLNNLPNLLSCGGILLLNMGVAHLRYAACGVDQIRKNLAIGTASIVIGGGALYIGLKS